MLELTGLGQHYLLDNAAASFANTPVCSFASLSPTLPDPALPFQTLLPLKRLPTCVSFVSPIAATRVTKVSLFVLVLPMTWRMVQKARSLYRRETAAKQAAKNMQAASYEPDDLTRGADAELAPAELPVASPGGSSCTDGAAAVGELSSLKGRSTAGCQGQQQPAHTAGDVEVGGVVSQQKAKVSCWQQPSQGLAQTDPGTCQEIRNRLTHEQARMLPPFQCGLLVLLLAYVAAASLLAGYLVSSCLGLQHAGGPAVSPACFPSSGLLQAGSMVCWDTDSGCANSKPQQ